MIERTQVEQARERDGRYVLTILKVSEKFKSGTTTYRKWEFGINENNVINRKIKIKLYPWESKSLLLAIGGKKEGTDILWEPDNVEGKSIEADLSTIEYKDKDGVKREKYALNNCIGLPY